MICMVSWLLRTVDSGSKRFRYCTLGHLLSLPAMFVDVDVVVFLLLIFVLLIKFVVALVFVCTNVGVAVDDLKHLCWREPGLFVSLKGNPISCACEKSQKFSSSAEFWVRRKIPPDKLPQIYYSNSWHLLCHKNSVYFQSIEIGYVNFFQAIEMIVFCMKCCYS